MDWLILGLIAFCGLVYLLFNELEDECVRNTWKKHKQFLNSNLSWRNKWEIGNTNKPRYFGSTTFLVWLTDGEHLFQFIKNRAIEGSLLLIGWQFAVAWIVGKSLMQIIKEKFINKIQ